LEFTAESREKLAQFLAFGMMLKSGEDFYAGRFISEIGEADGAEIGVLESEAFALSGGDGHTQRIAIALPWDDDRAETALSKS
jgi:hypothetical protein